MKYPFGPCVCSGYSCKITATPVLNFNGNVSFSFRIKDTTNWTNWSNVSLSVSPVNDAPVGENKSYTTLEDQTISGQVLGTDVDSSSLTYQVQTQPLHGSLTLNSNGSFSYVPTLNYNGIDSFTYVVNDGNLNSTPSTVSIIITPVNDAPSSVASSFSTNEDSTYTGSVSAVDVEGDTISYTISANPSKGYVTLNSSTGSFSYTPNANANGSDSFSFQSSDGLLSSSATVSVTINPVNDTPTTSSQSISTDEDTVFTGTLSASDIDGDTLTYSVVSQGSKGSVVVTNTSTGSFTYTPNANVHGSDSFVFKVNDGSIDSNSSTVSVTINSINDAPVANSGSFTTNENTLYSGTLTGSDVDGDSLTYSIVSQGTKGVVVITDASAGSFTYAPTLNANGSDSFTFRVNDGTTNSTPKTISVQISGVNDQPIDNPSSFSTNEDTPFAGVLTASDIDLDTLTYSVVSQGTKGVVVVNASTGTYVYTPNLNANGVDSFTFKVNDGTVDSSSVSVSVVINPVNDAPIATLSSFSTNEDSIYTGTLSGSDVDGDALTYTIVSTSTKGSIVITDAATGSFTYTPNLNANGVDSFTFKVNDGTIDSIPALVSVTINAQNDAPIAQDSSFSTQEDTLYSGALSSSDLDGDLVTYSIVTNPTKGSVVLLNSLLGLYLYTPDLNANGPDSFTFRVNDGTTNSNVSTVSITIVPVNDSPMASNLFFTTSEDSAFTGSVSGTDVDGDSLTYSVSSLPSKGILVLSPSGSFTYTPTLNANGSDSFSFQVSDGTLTSVGIATITISSDNDIPVANGASFTTLEDMPLLSALTGSDIDGDLLRFYIVNQPTNGSIVLSSLTGLFTYTPNANANGSDSFTFKVNDGTVDSAPVSVSISITPVNDMPVAQAQAITTTEDTAFSGTLTGSDIDGDTLTYSVVSQGLKGIAVVNSSGSFSYTPNANATGSDFFTFRVNDGSLFSSVAVVTVSIVSENDAPVASNLSISTNEDSTLSSSLSAYDVDGDSLTYSIVSQGTKGSVVVNATTGSFVYTPNLNANGSDSFTFRANDGSLNSNVATVSITINPVNDAPVASNLSISTNENALVSGTLSASDIDGDSLSFSVVSQGSKGSVSISATGSFTYTPSSHSVGSDTFTFRVSDGSLNSNVATVSVNIINVNDAPEGLASTFTTDEDVSVSGTLNGWDIDGDAITFSIVSQGSKGSVSITNASTGAFTYTPNLNATGSDVFTFRISDGHLFSAVISETVVITPVNDAPSISNSFINLSVKTDLSLSINFTIDDIDSSVSCSMVTTSSANATVLPTSNLSITGGSSKNCTLVVTPSLNTAGSSLITVSLSDGSLSTSKTFTANLVNVTGLSVSTALEKMPVGYKLNLVATATYSDSSTLDVSANATWASSNGSITSLGAGVFAGVSAGTALLSATHKGLSASAGSSLVVAWNNLTLSHYVINAGLNALLNIKAVVSLSDGSVFDVSSQSTWTVGNTSVAEINAGLILFRNVGSTSFSATFNSLTASGSLSTLNKSISNLSITGSNLINILGLSPYKAILTYSDGSTQDVTTFVTWGVDNDAIMKVSNADGLQGKVTALLSGSTYVTATMNGYSAQKSVGVLSLSLNALLSISVTPSNLIVAKGQKVQYKAIGTYLDGTTEDITSQVTWNTSSVSVATLSGSEASVVYTGSTISSSTISATAGLISGSTNLSVFTGTISSISISYSGNLAAGESVSLKALALSTDGGVLDITDLCQWSSSNPSVIGVSNSLQNKGYTSGLSVGSSTVVATFGSFSGSRSVVVASTSTAETTGDGLLAQYYTGTGILSFLSLVAQRVEADLNKASSSTANAVGVATNFSARFTGYVRAQATQNYYFCTDSDEGVRVWINGNLVIDNFLAHGSTRNCSGAIAMTKGNKYSVRVDYYQGNGNWELKLLWGSSTGTVTAITQQNLFTP